MRLFSAGTVVGQHARGGVVYVAALPGLVGHPEGHDHVALAGIVLFEDLPVQQGLLGERLGVGVGKPLLLKFRICV